MIRHRFTGLLLCAWLIGLGLPASAQQDISGTWRGTLTVAPDAAVTIHFVLTRGVDGAWSAVVGSPDPAGLPDTPASSVSFDGNRLELSVDALSGSYVGTLGDGGFDGEWRQEGIAFPLALRHFVRTELSQADRDRLAGSWVGRLALPTGASLALVFRFESGADGELTGLLDSPEQGAMGLAMANIELAGDELALNVPVVMGRYTGTFEGDRLVGTWSQGTGFPLTLERGEYVPTVATLDLAAADFARLAGTWHGQLGPFDVTIRFETNDDGTPAAYLDVPGQGVAGLPISSAALTGDELALRIDPIAATLTATLAGDELTGEWAQGPQAVPVTFSRR
jgi:hypothetical protein